MATVSKYGLQGEEEQTGGQGTTGAANVSGVTQNPGGNAANLNPFGQPRQVNPLGAATVIPQVQQFAFNPKYAAQSTAIEQALANQDLNRQNQLGAIDVDLGRAKGEAQRSRDKALEQLINKYASSGILGSGIDAGSRGERGGYGGLADPSDGRHRGRLAARWHPFVASPVRPTLRGLR